MMPVQKGKEVILLKKLIRKYGHVWMLSYAFIYIPWFTRLQENINKPYHVMHTALDDLIPFNEYFIVPYLMWFLYVAASIEFFFFKNRDDYYRLCTFLFTGMTISLLVCSLFPNGTDFRPAYAYVIHLCSDYKFSNLRGLLYFTDGMGTYPARRPGYDTAFLFLGERFDDANVPPWAMKVVLDEEEFTGAAARPASALADALAEEDDLYRELNNS